MEAIRTYPDLSAVCIKERLDLPLRLWYLLRHAYNGQGWVTKDDAYHLSCGNRRQTRAWIRRGMGVFWTKDSQDRLWLAGLSTLCERLGVIPWRGSVEVPFEDVKSLEKFRATLYASWFAFKPRTISRDKLSGIFGRSVPTLRKWERIAGMKVQRNMAWCELPADGDYSKFPPGVLKALGIKTADGETKPGYAWIEYQRPVKEQSRYTGRSSGVVYGGISPVVCWFLPNTYSSSLETKPATTLQRKARRRVKDTLVCVPRAKSSRLFFAQGQSRGINKTLQREGIAFINEGRMLHGMRLWSFQHV